MEGTTSQVFDVQACQIVAISGKYLCWADCWYNITKYYPLVLVDAGGMV